ncbi:MAG: UbiD family decarboxylase [Planctomycetota bacterium]|nr:UbiD family decarboxylase [Planctomycetaceae bacterium]MDQ3331929.1 UbiD family decarboxylase [Planctomycetota bacterium]
MGYRNLQQCVRDLERDDGLVRIAVEVDPCQEAAAIHRRVFAAGGPALLFERVKGCRFPLLSNLFGTSQRTHFLFRDTLDAVRNLVELKTDPTALLRRPWQYRNVPLAAWTMRPKPVRRGPVLEHSTRISEFPQVMSWPNDGGPFVTLPEVYTEDPDAPGVMKSNLGMYRVQMAGNDYLPDAEVGLHYQIHRSIGVHHAKALQRGEPFRVNIFVGGAPAMILAAVMPLPEGLSELMFAGALGGHRIPMMSRNGGPAIYAEADFCVCGTVLPTTKPEGPFGDHLGYYSLKHDFPVLKVDAVYHRRDAIWPFTVVGRPPQEDTAFGEIIHELTGPAIPSVLPGVHGIHAVDAAGVHPLLLAIGSERYVPYAEARRPQELLTIANAILGQGQLSLAKYLLIVAKEDDPRLDIHDVPAFFRHVLSRIDWSRDLHFQTRTTIDTLDYSGTGFNEGSKVVMAAAGPVRRELPSEVPSGFRLPESFNEPRIVLPGIVTVTGPNYRKGGKGAIRGFCGALGEADHPLSRFALVVVSDDSRFVAETLNNFLWVTFTRSNPAVDIDGVGAFVEDKHWGCRGPLVIDARIKPHHAPPLEEDPVVTKRVESLAAQGGPLQGLY